MLTCNYIIPSMTGRMGNHMFMIAHAYAKALEYNRQFVVYKNHAVQEGYDYSENIFRKIDFIDVFNDNQNYNPKVPSEDKHSIYVGYYQSEKHFEKYSENIKSLFSPPYAFIRDILKKLSVLNSQVAVISIRRGDYLKKTNYHPIVSVEYITEALNHISRDQDFLIMSNDIPWCKKNIHIPFSTYLEGYPPHEQMWIMSMCHHFIISNSSFSWWGAYLSRNPDKIVIAPETWFGPEGPPNWKGIYCKDWTVLPTYFENGLIMPK